MADLVISIGSLGNFALLERCLRSIYEEDSAAFTFEIWIVYNGPGDDGVCEKIEAQFPSARLIRRRNPLGFCVTHNLVLGQARGRYFLILDDDTIVPRGTLSRMMSFMEAHPRAGIAGCKTLNSDGSRQRSYGLYPSFRTEFANIFRASSFWPDRIYRGVDSAREVEWLNGSFMLVRDEIVRNVGTLDEHYYTYGCEPDWCLRIRRAGWGVYFVPEAEIVHIGGEHSIVTSRTAAKKYVNVIRSHVNRFYFFRKHYGRLSLALLRPIMALGCAARILFFSLLYISKPEIRLVAAVRIRAFLRIIAICFSAEPYNMPHEFDPPASESESVTRDRSERLSAKQFK